jgi:hypothetical protein
MTMPDDALISKLIDEFKAAHQQSKEVVELQQEQINKLNKLLLGNGTAGLCEQVRIVNSHLRAIWTLVCVFGATLLGGVFRFWFTR